MWMWKIKESYLHDNYTLLMLDFWRNYALFFVGGIMKAQIILQTQIRKDRILKGENGYQGQSYALHLKCFLQFGCWRAVWLVSL